MKTSVGEELELKYEFSFCLKCKKFHVDMEDGYVNSVKELHVNMIWMQ